MWISLDCIWNSSILNTQSVLQFPLVLTRQYRQHCLLLLLLFPLSCLQKYQSWRSVVSRWQQSERACPPSSLCPSSPCWQHSSWSSWSVACQRSLLRCWRSWCDTVTSPRATSLLVGFGRAWRSSPMRSECCSYVLCLAGPGCLPTQLISRRSSKSSRLIGWGHH